MDLQLIQSSCDLLQLGQYEHALHSFRSAASTSAIVPASLGIMLAMRLYPAAGNEEEIQHVQRVAARIELREATAQQFAQLPVATSPPLTWMNGMWLLACNRNEEAAAVFKTCAAMLYAAGQSSYAWCLQNGVGVAKNAKAASKLCGLAAKQGFALAQNSLGTCYEVGDGKFRSYTKAATWYKQSSDQLLPAGMINYARFLSHGLGGAPCDQTRAIALLVEASKRGADSSKELRRLIHPSELAALQVDGMEDDPNWTPPPASPATPTYMQTAEQRRDIFIATNVALGVGGGGGVGGGSRAKARVNVRGGAFGVEEEVEFGDEEEGVEVSVRESNMVVFSPSNADWMQQQQQGVMGEGAGRGMYFPTA